MNIFLTGGTGFIGSYILMELLKENHCITVLARNKNKIPALNKMKNVEVIEGDITNYNLIKNLIKGQDACILVALNYTKNTGYEVLVEDTAPSVYIADIAIKENVKQLIYTSSTAVNDNLYMGKWDDYQDNITKVTSLTKQRPATLYGATKAATENYLIALSYSTHLKVNIVRPGYTFGNPILENASTQSDTRFKDIVEAAINNENINIIKNDGTQFIHASDLAKIYLNILNSSYNRKTYYGVSKEFTSWYSIAQEAVKQCKSKSKIEVIDKGYIENGVYWDVSDIKKDFDLEFNSAKHIKDHVGYLKQNNSKF